MVILVADIELADTVEAVRLPLNVPLMVLDAEIVVALMESAVSAAVVIDPVPSRCTNVLGILFTDCVLIYPGLIVLKLIPGCIIVNPGMVVAKLSLEKMA